jgi:hypothetical protein
LRRVWPFETGLGALPSRAKRDYLIVYPISRRWTMLENSPRYSPVRKILRQKIEKQFRRRKDGHSGSGRFLAGKRGRICFCRRSRLLSGLAKSDRIRTITVGLRLRDTKIETVRPSFDLRSWSEPTIVNLSTSYNAVSAGTNIGANGSDIFQRLCPVCQGRSARAGLLNSLSKSIFLCEFFLRF